MGCILLMGFPGDSVIKTPPANAGDMGSTPRLGRSPGEGNGCALQYSCQGNPIDREAWQATVHGVAKVRHDLGTEHHHHHLWELGLKVHTRGTFLDAQWLGCCAFTAKGSGLVFGGSKYLRNEDPTSQVVLSKKPQNCTHRSKSWK